MKIINLYKDSRMLLKNTFSQFIEDDAIKLSAALSYYTIFSLPPLIIIIISLSGVFFGEEAVKGEIFGQINGLVGNEAAMQIQEMIKHVSLSGKSKFATVVGLIALLIGASGVFSEIQDSINFIWGLKAKPKRGLIKFLKNRLMSFSMIGAMGFLLIVGLMVNTIMELLSSRLQNFFPQFTVEMFYVFNQVFLFIIITILFVIIFKTLPDGKVVVKDAIIGAVFTTVLFMIGKYAIGFYLGNSQITSYYGAAGSVIIILVWVYFSAIILYFGAEFTKAYAIAHGDKIIPKSYAVQIQKHMHEIPPKVIDINNAD